MPGSVPECVPRAPRQRPAEDALAADAGEATPGGAPAADFNRGDDEQPAAAAEDASGADADAVDVSEAALGGARAADFTRGDDEQPAGAVGRRAWRRRA